MKNLMSTFLIILCTIYPRIISSQTLQYLYKHSKQTAGPDTILINYVSKGVSCMKYSKDTYWLTKIENDSTCIMEMPGTIVSINKKPFVGVSLYNDNKGVEYVYPMNMENLTGEYRVMFLGTENGMRKYSEKTKILNTDGSILFEGRVTTTFSKGEYIYSQYGNDSEGYYSITLCK